MARQTFISKIILALVMCSLILGMGASVVAQDDDVVDEYAPPPVGGEVASPSKLELLGPWVALLAGISSTVGAVLLRAKYGSGRAE